jgi:hypothetical protein
MCLEGARQVVMTDLSPHMDDMTFKATVDFLRKERGLAQKMDGIEQISDLPITYLAPMTSSNIVDGSVDFVVSRTVLEHIPPDSMIELFRTLRAKMKPNGLMLHVIDNSDHMEHRDKSISRLNFLTLSNQRHMKINEWMRGGENRLRHHEYRELFGKAGFKVIAERGESHTVTESEVAILRPKLQPHFASMSPKQLAVLTSYFVLAPVTD